MIRISEFSVPPDLASPRTERRTVTTPAGTAANQAPDDVQLTHSANAPSQQRLDYLAAVKAMVGAPDYSPSSTLVSRKLVSGALSRTD